MDNDSKKLTFIRRANAATYLENQTVSIGAGGGSVDVTNLLKGDDVEAFEFELDGERLILLGFRPTT